MRFLFPYFIFAIVLAISAAPVHAQMETAAKQAFVMDYDTKMVLFEKNADERMPTSSMSKVVTMYAVLDAIKNGKLTRDAALTVSEKAWRMGGSKMFVEVGKQVKVEDLMRGVIIQSGNDA
ncbi:MAG: D-alanyl-D-alanine carboxypeptidase, partial [Proteobacteria bacterium]|nr:D-alanyl-D-alanine carboxypeptidase [Pseudomonadota bacterium]